MTYQRVVPKVIFAHVALLALFLVIPLIRSCEWFKKPPLETIEIDVSDLPPPPPPVERDEPDEQEDDAVIPKETPKPTAQPTPRPTPTATPTPAPEATAVPTATPRPLPTPTPTPTPTWKAASIEEIRARMEQQQNNPEPAPTARPLRPEELARMMGEGLSPVSSGTTSGGSSSVSGTVSFGGVAQVLIPTALKFGEASIVSPFNYTGIVWGVFVDLLLWSVYPSWWTIAGAAVITLAGLYIFRREAVVQVRQG